MSHQYPPQHSDAQMQHPPQACNAQTQSTASDGGIDNIGFTATSSYAPSYAADAAYAEGGVPKSEIGFNDASIRARFIRKVFFIVAIMLTVVTVMTAVPFVHQPTLDLIRHNRPLYYVGYIVFVITYFMIVCFASIRRTFPCNIICTSLLTVALGFMTMVIASYHEASYVLMALTVTVVVSLAATLFATQTKYDFTSKIGWLIVATFFLLIFGIVAIVALRAFHVKTYYIVFAFLGAVLFTVWLIYDVQMMMGGKKHEISPEDHFEAAVQIFIDIVYIFWYILTIFDS